MYPIRTLESYKPERLSLLGNIYTTVYLGNYIAGDYGEENGSHPWVDIVPMHSGDSVFAVLEGIVITATENASEGKYIVLRHDWLMVRGSLTSVYSCFLHLSEITVSVWQKVQEGDIIGKTGNTGQSTGEHLHFQIDTSDAPFHPYWPFTIKEARDLGLGFMEAVNRGLWMEQAKKFTLNPLVFLDAQKTVQKNTSSIAGQVSVVPPPKIASQDVSIFSDVPSTHPNARAIQFLKDGGIVSGQGGAFRPNASVTRQEALKMICGAAKIPPSSDVRSFFSDIPERGEFIPYINAFRERKAVSGYPDGTFRPNAPITRAEGLKMAFVTTKNIPTPNGPVYLDVKRTDWFAPFALWSRDESVLVPRWPNFMPQAQLTRAELAEILYRLYAK